MPQVNEFAALIDARQFGAQGDGVNNDAPHIQAAIFAAAAYGGSLGAAVYLPPGTYLINTPIQGVDGVTICGAGNATILLLGRDQAFKNLDAFTVPNGATFGFQNLLVRGPSIPGVFTIRFCVKVGATGAIFMSGVDAENEGDAHVVMPVGNSFVLEGCSEVAEDYYPITGATQTLEFLENGLWVGGLWPRRMKGTADPSAGGGVEAAEGSIYQRYVNNNGQLWLKTGTADTAWTDISAGGGGGTLQDAYNNGPPVSITLTNALGGITIIDGAPAVTGNLFTVTDNAAVITYLGVSATEVTMFDNWQVDSDSIDFVAAASVVPTATIRTSNAGGAEAAVDLFLQVGTGAAAGAGAATDGGTMSIAAGVGGAANAAFAAGGGGAVSIVAGAGGVAATPRAAGAGGVVVLQAGTGGGGNAAIPGGAGGSTTIGAGLGGVGTATGVAGAGGALTLVAGDSGASGGAGLGVGGAVAITAGAGGNSGGAVTITGGAANVGALGGNVVLHPGNGTTSAGFVDALIDDAVTTVSDVVRVRKNLAGAAAVGTGAAVLYRIDNAASTETNAVRAAAVWTDPTNGAEIASYTISAANLGSFPTVAQFVASGSSIIANDTATNTATDVLTLTHLTSGAAAANYGTATLIRGENDAGNAADMGRASVAWTDPAIGSEDSIWRWQTRTAGAALAQVLAADSTRVVASTAYQIGTEATTQWSATVAAPTVTYTVANSTFNHAFTQTTVATSGAHTFMTMTSARNTAQTASTEIPTIRLNISAGRQWSTGAIATQRSVLIDAPTFDFVGASTVTRASTLYVAGPIAGTNATITTGAAMWGDRTTAQTNTNADILLVSHQSSGTPATGFGAGIKWILPDSAGTLFDVGRIQVDLVTATAANPTTQFTFFARASGSLTSIGTWTNAGTLDTTIVRGTSSIRAGSGNNVIISSAGAFTGASVNGMTFSFTGSSTAAAASYIFQTYARNTVGSEAIGWDWDASTTAVTFIAGTFTTQRTHYMRAPAYIGTAAGSTITNVTMLAIDTIAASGANMTYTNMRGVLYGSSATVGPSGTTTQYRGIELAAHTITYTVATGSTQTVGVAGVHLGQITVAQNTGAGTLTVTSAATLYIVGAPIAGTGSAITNPYAIWVDAGLVRLDGDGTNVIDVPVNQAAPGAAARKIAFFDRTAGVQRFIMVSDT